MAVVEHAGKVALRVEATDPNGCVRGWYEYIDRENDASWEDVYKRMGVKLGMTYDATQSVTLQILDFLVVKKFKSPSVYWITQKEIDDLTSTWDTVAKGEPQLGIPASDSHYKFFDGD